MAKLHIFLSWIHLALFQQNSTSTQKLQAMLHFLLHKAWTVWHLFQPTVPCATADEDPFSSISFRTGVVVIIILPSLSLEEMGWGWLPFPLPFIWIDVFVIVWLFVLCAISSNSLIRLMRAWTFASLSSLNSFSSKYRLSDSLYCDSNSLFCTRFVKRWWTI